MHSEDTRALAKIIGAFRQLAREVESKEWQRSKLFSGDPLRVPIPSGDDAGKWLEVRLVDVSEIVEDGLEAK